MSGNKFLIPGATVTTMLMLGILHARRLYDDKKVCIFSTCKLTHSHHSEFERV
jgi:hypothetical protein